MIAVCVKWVDMRPDIDALHGTVEPAVLGAGFSDADQAAVEVALRLGAARGGQVLAVCMGPVAADEGLRELSATGVDRVVRIDGDGSEASAAVAEQLAATITAELAAGLAATSTDAAGGSGGDLLVLCGDVSVDRGSGSVPAFLAHELEAAQALGLIQVETDVASPAGEIEVLRRLDGGRRERLSVCTPAVLSVEGGVVELRRASLAAVLRTADAEVPTMPGAHRRVADHPRLRPWRPRARVVAPPAGATALDRIVSLTGALVERTPPIARELDPEDAADAILEQLRAWGYVHEPPDS
ncbi:MAG: mycofactocin-associated electron transfer flavoprotein beta subunit [Microthrixaceae bacterium]